MAKATTQSTPPRAPRVLTRRELNRATLARQLLLERSDAAPSAAVDQLLGLQAQSPTAPYYQLWARLRDFRAEQLSELLESRRAVRIAMMRSTVHLVSERDCRWLRPLLQPVLDRGVPAAARRRLAAAGTGPDAAAAVAEAVTEAARTLVEERPRAIPELLDGLAAALPGAVAAGVERDDFIHVVRAGLALVQVPPRGLWGRAGRTTVTTAESWLGAEQDRSGTVEELVVRYLAAFGPATAADFRVWSGLGGAAALRRLRPELAVFRDEAGRELFDLPDAPRPDGDVPAPVRLLGPFDNVGLSHADRTRLLSEPDRKRTQTVNGQVPGIVLVDGVGAGMWRLDREAGGAAAPAVLGIRPFADAPRGAVREAVAAEAERLLRLAAPEASAHEVRFLPGG